MMDDKQSLSSDDDNKLSSTHEELYESKSQMKRVEILKAEEKQMSRDELLAKITKTGFIGLQIGKEPNEVIYDWKTNALRAVVELCKQADETTGNLITTDVIIAVIEKELQ